MDVRHDAGGPPHDSLVDVPADALDGIADHASQDAGADAARDAADPCSQDPSGDFARCAGKPWRGRCFDGRCDCAGIVGGCVEPAVCRRYGCTAPEICRRLSC